jgi:hypothetical protein
MENHMEKQCKSNPSFSEVYLKEFIKNNPHVEVSIDEEQIIIEKPWMRDDVRLKCDKNDSEFIEILNSIGLSPKFDAIFHNDLNKAEFIYSYVQNS